MAKRKRYNFQKSRLDLPTILVALLTAYSCFLSTICAFELEMFGKIVEAIKYLFQYGI